MVHREKVGNALQDAMAGLREEVRRSRGAGDDATSGLAEPEEASEVDLPPTLDVAAAALAACRIEALTEAACRLQNAAPRNKHLDAILGLLLEQCEALGEMESGAGVVSWSRGDAGTAIVAALPDRELRQIAETIAAPD